MNFFDNSMFSIPEMTFIKFHLSKAIAKSRENSLENLDRSESRFLVGEYIVPVFEEITKDITDNGSFMEEKDYVLMRIHGWFFLSWMNSKLNCTFKTRTDFQAIGTLFYIDMITACGLEKYTIQVDLNI